MIIVSTMLKSFLSLFLLALSIQVWAKVGEEPGEHRSPSNDRTRCAEMLTNSLRSELGIPGLAVAVRKGGESLFVAAEGLAHVELGIPLETSTRFQISSTSKIFTGTLLLLLAEEGVVDLQASIRDRLPEAPPGWQDLTLRHCLTHTSGLPSWEEIKEALPEDPKPSLIMKRLYETSPDPKPGRTFRYNQVGYLLVQQVVERVLGLPFQQAIKERVLLPAGSETGRFWSSDREVLAGAATQYYPDGKEGLLRREFHFPSFLHSAAGLALSLDDLRNFDDALTKGRMMGPSALESLWEPTPLLNGESVSYSLGWDVKTHAPGQHSTGHSGGYLTTYRRYRPSELSVIFLSNGFTIPQDEMNPDNLATAFAAIWNPEILGLEDSPCRLFDLASAQF